ncbi:uncharacterized protein [Coffea arabica]|uniref:Uncharacterized protein n=1 Tax=Coffea arabica TaxID=13443 RepID=A0A6P6WAZ8_COFAR|nr:uncharacterized protein LOC113731523 [Coffea arabica]
MVMALLKSGVLEKHLQELKDEDQTLGDDRKPVLLQIRSIIPVLEEGDLFPDRGFYLKVSDASHAMYVSLPQEQNDMILSNKLKLGQFIYVHKLEKSEPVPLIRGLTPVPGRRPCEGSPEDIHSPTALVKFLQVLDTDPVVEKGVISEKTINEDSTISRKPLHRGLSDSEGLIRNHNGLQQRPRGRFRSLSASRARHGERTVGSRSSKPTSTDDDSDSDSTLSSVSLMSKRKSWTQSDILGLKQMFDSSAIKNESKPVAKSLSANVSPVRSMRYDSSDECSSSTTRRRDVSSTKKLVKGTNKSRTPVPKVISEQTSQPVSSLVHDGKGAETAIAWESLPSKLVKLGKEVVRQRDIALSAAADALQEACAAERLLNSLSTYSEFHVSGEEDVQPYVDKFFDLQDDLARTRLIVQSLTNISPFKTPETDANGTTSVKEALNIALERKKNATTWIKSAVAFDLSTCSSDPLKLSVSPVAATDAVKKPSRCVKPKGARIIRRQRTNDDLPLLVASDKDYQAEWTRGSTLCAAADLASLLQDECRKLFLSYVENYLEEVESKTSSMHSDRQVSGMMYKVKRVNDWLNVFIGKEPNLPGDDGFKIFSNLDDSEREAYGRVRNKIYEILLNHVERTALAFGKS